MSNYKVNSGQSIFDVVNKTTMDLNTTYDIIQNNNIESIGSDLVGINIEYAPPPITPPTLSGTEPPINSNIKEFYSIPNQSVYDIVLQNYGDLNKTYQLIKDSNFSNILVYPLPKTVFKFNPAQVKDYSFASYLSKKGIIINTINGMRPSSTNYLLQEDGFYFDLENGSGKIKLE